MELAGLHRRLSRSGAATNSSDTEAAPSPPTPSPPTSWPPRGDLRWGRRWIALVALLTLYNLLSIPLRLAFRSLWCNTTATAVFGVFDYLGDVIFVVDMCFTFRFAVLQDGIEIRDRKAIRKDVVLSSPRTAWEPRRDLGGSITRASCREGVPPRLFLLRFSRQPARGPAGVGTRLLAARRSKA